MPKILIYPIGCTDSLTCAVQHLQERGYALTDHPSPDVSHVLLDIPSFSEPGKLRCGIDIKNVLEVLPTDITVIGGFLEDSALLGYRKLDLLADPIYLARNAAITAECALTLAASKLRSTLSSISILVIGWGRIGKNLCRLLRGIGADVTVYARKASDQAVLQSMGFHTVAPEELPEALPGYRLIFNTAPAPVLTDKLVGLCRKCLKLDLASTPGIAGEDTLHARGLPGRMAPETAGKLIAETIAKKLEVKQ